MGVGRKTGEVVGGGRNPARPSSASLESEGRGPPGYAAVLPQYKSTPGKKVSVVGWMVQLPDDPEHPDIFQLNNPDKGRQQAGHWVPTTSLYSVFLSCQMYNLKQ